MITKHDIEQAEEIVAQQHDDIRAECQFCKKFLHGNPNALRVSHGACFPLCAEAKAYGYTDLMLAGFVPPGKGAP